MPGKMARSDPRPSVRVTRGAGSGQHLASVLPERRENANIDAGLGFIWRISVQYIWRKLVPGERDLADIELNKNAYRLIHDEEYSLAERILDYGIHHTGKPKDVRLRTMVVNYANAIKLGGDKDRALKELHKLDWSASDLSFRISVAAMEDDLSGVLALMPQGAKSDLMPADAYRDWPVFRTLRGEAAFREKFKAVYREELVRVPARPGEPARGSQMPSSTPASGISRKRGQSKRRRSATETRH